MLIQPGELLAKINSPDDLKKHAQSELVKICDELRQYIVDNVSVYGGHFGASLGVVELTVALHYVFHTPLGVVFCRCRHNPLLHVHSVYVR